MGAKNFIFGNPFRIKFKVTFNIGPTKVSATGERPKRQNKTKKNCQAYSHLVRRLPLYIHLRLFLRGRPFLFPVVSISSRLRLS